jgi:uncharacterized membrane protein HdeD (DUF308 family)
LMRTLKTMSMASGESHWRLDEWPVETTEPGWQALYRVAGVAAFVQLACTLLTILIFYTVGGEPGTVDEYFTVRSQRRPGCWPMGLIGFMSCLASFCLESQTCS